MRALMFAGLSCLFLYFGTSFAGVSKDFSEHSFLWQGQDAENFELMTTQVETRFRLETTPSTCTREVPYTENVCGNETRYRQECHTVPGYQDCRWVTETQCHPVTRYREECRNEGGGQQCSREPDREECSMVNGRRVCRRVPGREVCRDIPGRRVCRNVAYRDQECRDVRRENCEWIPARQECQNIPYNEWVCRDVTRYRTESYACSRVIRVPYEVERKITARLEYFFDENMGDEGIKFVSKLADNGEISIMTTDESSHPRIIRYTREIEQIDDGDDLIIKAKYYFHFLKSNEVLPALSKRLQDLKLKRNSMSLSSGLLRNMENFQIELALESSSQNYFRGVIPVEALEIKDSRDVDGNLSSLITIDFKKLGFKLSSFKNYEVKVVLRLKGEGEFLNLADVSLKQTMSEKVFLGF